MELTLVQADTVAPLALADPAHCVGAGAVAYQTPLGDTVVRIVLNIEYIVATSREAVNIQHVCNI